MRRRSVGSILKLVTSCLHKIFFLSSILFLFFAFFQPIGALLLEQCRVEKEDSQSFSVGELQHPVFPFLLLLTKLVFSSPQCCLSYALEIAMCGHEKFCVSASSISWWSREEISVWMWLRGAVCGVGGCHYQGQVELCSFPFYQKTFTCTFRDAWCMYQSQGHHLVIDLLFSSLAAMSSWGKTWFSIGLKSTGSLARWGSQRWILVKLIQLK